MEPHILKIEEFGKWGDKTNKWGCSVRVVFTPIVNYQIQAWFEHDHWVLRRTDNEHLYNVVGIGDVDKIDETGEKIYSLIKEKMVPHAISVLEKIFSNYKGNVQIYDETRYAV